MTRGDDRGGVKPNVITLKDCEVEDQVGFKINPISASNLTLEVWAGTSTECGNRQHSTTLDGSQCWQLVTFNPPPAAAFKIPVREILPHGAGPAPATVCEDTAKTATGTGSVTVYFIPVAGNMNSGSTATYAMTFDTKGPPPPTNFSVQPGDSRLLPSWKAVDSTDINNYQLYCEPTTDCTSDVLIPGEIPSSMLPDTVKTGTTPSIAKDGEVADLENGQLYICAMAGVDKNYNVGPLSETDCETPKPVDGYFKVYREAGGTAGGGFCSFGRAPINRAMLPLVLGGLGLLVARRWRRGSRR